MTAIGEDLSPGPRDHVVHFYGTDDELFGAIGRSLAAALSQGEAVVFIAEPGHRQALVVVLGQAGVDVADAQAAGRLLMMDAAEVLAQISVDGSIDPDAFDAVVGTPIRQAAVGRPVRVYGEMVSLLWTAGDVTGAIDLERRWNELAGALPFSLSCGYPVDVFADAAACEAFMDVCDLHSDVIAAAPAGPGSEASRRFPPALHSPRLARRFVCDTLAAWDHDELLDDAAIVVTELTTNAIEHAGSDVVVGLSRIDGGVRLVVTDGSTEPPVRRDRDATSPRGRGLPMVDAVARRWGHDALDAGKVIWAELACGTQPGGDGR